jgi:integrase
VHEVTLYLNRFRRKGRAANTIHSVCGILALLYRSLDGKVDLIERLSEGNFLTAPELERLASIAQFRVNDLSEDEVEAKQLKVIDIKSVRVRKKGARPQLKPVDVATHATRLRYMASYLKFISDYIGATLPKASRRDLIEETTRALEAFESHIPSVTKRAKLDARMGLSVEEQERVLRVVHPWSPDNPWKAGFVRHRNWLIVVLLFATGMRRGELLGLQVADLSANSPKLRIVRRADAEEDDRLHQPNTKTLDREIELRPELMRAVWEFVNKHRRAIKAARSIPQLFVSDDGSALSSASMDKIFRQLREACPSLSVKLTGHVPRHTWNDRFSAQAESMGLSDKHEEDARNSQQGWTEGSKMASTYTKRYAAQMGRAISLKLQEKLDVQLKPRK